MRLPVLLLVAGFAGCCSAPPGSVTLDAVTVGLMQAEIAAMGSVMKDPGPRSQKQRDDADAQVKRLQGRFK